MDFKPVKPPEVERYQVRFWSTPELYKKFCDRVSRDGFKIGNMLNQFMEQYAARPIETPAREGDGE